MRILGIEFAPLNIPLHRRLQTAAVLKWTLCFLLMGILCSLIFIYLLFTTYYFLSLAYLVWYIYDFRTGEQGGRRQNWMVNWSLWRYFRDYFPIQLLKTAELDPNKNYILGYHPHGIMSCGAFCNFATEATRFKDLFPGITSYLHVLQTHFRFPYFREYILATGCCSVSRSSMEWILQNKGVGNALALVIGGAVEALEANPGKFALKLKSRKGFIKIALKYGASLVPVFSFGENDLFFQVSNPEGSLLKGFQYRLSKILGCSPPLFYGRGIFNYSFGLLPFRKPINTVVGKPIDVPKIDNPAQEDIDTLHEKYIAALQDLFESNKLKYGIGKMKHLTFI